MSEYKLNPDENKVNKVKEAIKKNDGYCPCTMIKNEDTKCVCKEMRETGHCRCGLYVK